MTTGPVSRPEDDNYASAAEKLLGIDLSASQVPRDPIDLDDADLFGPPDVVEPPAASADEPTPEPVRSAAAFDDDDDFGGDFGAGLDPAHEERPARKEQRPARSIEAVEESEDVAPAPATVAKKDDAYWDALEGWDWSDDTGTGPSKAEPREERGRQRSGDRSRRGSRSSERSGSSDRSSRRPAEPPPSRPQRSPRPARESFGDDFGSGLEDESRGGESAPEDSSITHSPAESSSRYRDEEPLPDVSTFPLNPSESQARSVDRGERSRGGSRRPPRPPEPSGESDDFGAGLDETAIFEAGAEPGEAAPPSEEGEGRRGRRRRGGRGRGRERGRTDEVRSQSESRQVEPPPPVEDSFGDVIDEPLFESQAPVDTELQESRFADVPTWSEAVALLVKGRPRTADSGGGRGRGEGSSESSERGGDRGGRGRGGRRGGGRRRSE